MSKKTKKPTKPAKPIKPALISNAKIYYALLTLGAALRIVPYILDRSLWLDEAMLALNITDKSFAGLLHPLDYGQVAPVLFLLIEKAIGLPFGYSEYSLRFFPLVCGLLCLPLIYRLTKSLTGSTVAALIALFILSTSCLIIYYSEEVKQYECDLFVTLCLLYLVFDKSLHISENKRYILLAVAGAVFLFLSNVTVLVLFTIGIYYLFKYRLKIFSQQRVLLAVFGAWIAAFAINYFYFLYNEPNRAYLDVQWQSDFMPFSSAVFSWVYTRYSGLFNEIYTSWYALVFVIAAIIFIVKRQWLFLYLLAFPLLLHFGVSGLKLYPFHPRLILYLTAFITPMLAAAIFDAINAIQKNVNKYFGTVVLVVVLSFMVVELAQNSFIWHEEEIRDSIAFINANSSPGQKVYVYYGAGFATMYYERIKYTEFDKDDVIMGTNNRKTPQNYIKEIQNLSGDIWLLFSHDLAYVGDPSYASEVDFIMRQLVQSGNVSLEKSFRTVGSSAFLIKIRH